MNRNVAVVHYNTPELTEAAILSLRKHGGKDYKVFVFDNSDARPFSLVMNKNLGDITIFDNTQSQLIDFDKELAKYPEKDEKLGCSKGCNYGSDKHMMSVQMLWELIPDGFVLMDSDILIKQSFDFMFMEDECVCGHITKCAGPLHIERLAPMLLWINVPLCKAGGATFFDPNRAWALHKGVDDRRNCWDTGAALLDDIKRNKPQCHGRKIDIRPLIIHFGSGSWLKNDIAKQQEWLEKNRELWEVPKGKKRTKYSVLSYIFNAYETPHEIVEKDPEAEYILVTDDPNMKSESWTVFYDGSLLGLSPFDKCYQVRFHPFKYVSTDTVIRVDGSIQIKAALKPFIEHFQKGKFERCLMIHPKRDIMKDEYQVWVDTRKYPAKQAKHCLEFMEHLGYDISLPLGIYQGCFEIVKKCHKNDVINALVFDFLKFLGEGNTIERIDQTVLTFVINHLFNENVKVLPVDESIITKSEFMQWYNHNSRGPIPHKEDCITPKLFGFPCTTWKPIKESESERKEAT